MPRVGSINFFSAESLTPCINTVADSDKGCNPRNEAKDGNTDGEYEDLGVFYQLMHACGCICMVQIDEKHYVISFV